VPSVNSESRTRMVPALAFYPENNMLIVVNVRRCVTMRPGPFGGSLPNRSWKMRPLLVTLLIMTPLPAIAAAATFTGTTTATFAVKEILDGTTTTATKTAPVNFTLTTDYTTVRWTMSWNANLVISGGPTQSFETDLATSGSITSRHCPSSTYGCSVDGPGFPSPLSFPDATGKSGAGSNIMIGAAGWSLTDRVVTASRTRTSPQLPVAGSGNVQYTGNPVFTNQGYSANASYLTVANYPTNITLTPGYQSGNTTWADTSQPMQSQWNFGNGYFDLGHIGHGTNDDLDVYISSMPATITLTEALSGDFNDSKTVDMADYVLWRDSPGPLAPFLSSYSAWRSGFGTSSAGLGSAAVPEPSSFVLLGSMLAIAFANRSRP
jgi:hypothetical protein